MNYYLKRTCKNCGQVDSFELTKKQAAFSLYSFGKYWDRPCTRCGSKECDALGGNQPDIDKELLDMWGNDTSLFFLGQDEELLLADYEYLPLLLQAIDEGQYLGKKINTLVEAVCILLFDNIGDDEEYSEEENKKRAKIAEEVRAELIKRKQKVNDADRLISAYIKEVVYPQIGLQVDPN